MSLCLSYFITAMENKPEAKRAKNFTEAEKNLFMGIAKEFSHIIDNKKTDTKTVRVKKETWEVITNRYNNRCQTGERNSKQLKALYDILRKQRIFGSIEVSPYFLIHITRKNNNIFMFSYM